MTVKASADSQGKRGKAVTGIGRAMGRVAGEFKALRPHEQLLERNAHFEPGQGCSLAKMDALAPDQAGICAPLGLDDTWIIERTRVAIGDKRRG